MNEKRILIVGGAGFVSTHLSQDLSQKHLVQSTSHMNLEKDQIKYLVQTLAPQVVIYAAGSNDLLFAEKNPRICELHHTTGAIHFSEASDSIKAKMIYISSDLVFSGSKGNFSETDAVGTSFQLGKSKIAAENHIKNNSGDFVIIRCAPLIGRGTLTHPSLIDHLREASLTKKSVKMNAKMIRNPVHVSVLTHLIAHVIVANVKKQILHVGGLTKATEFELARRFNTSLVIEETGDMNADFSLNFSETIRSHLAERLTLKESLSRLER